MTYRDISQNLPGVVVDLPTLTEKDIKDITEWGIKNEVDYIAASFVRKASDVHQIREILGDMDGKIKIYCKIENQEGMENYSDILAATDGIMVSCSLFWRQLAFGAFFMYVNS